MTTAKQYDTYYSSALGTLKIITDDKAVLSIHFSDAPAPENSENPPSMSQLPPVMTECIQQLDEYFKGERREFELELNPKGTPFQIGAWEQLKKIPYGQTISYGEQATRMGNTKACRAVGMANGKNKIPIIIPCHRVVGKDGTLTGFSAGVWRKKWLLEHEQKILKQMETSSKGGTT